MNTDEDFMRLALTLARKGLGSTSPNPAVGAVIVRNGEVLSRGWHRQAGKPHAEIEALRALPTPDLARGATLYVTLEPCSTSGRTPPCVEAIIRHDFTRVVVGAVDPNPAHAGRGLTLLQNAGIELTTGVLTDECEALNEGFNRWILTGQPFVIAKSAMSLDGRITRPPGEGQWLTSEVNRRRGQRLRATVDAILVGAETVRRDNPQLTVRNSRGVPRDRQPWRVVISRSGDLPALSNIFTDAWKERTLVFPNLREALDELGRREVLRVLIEGGGKLLGSAFEQGLVDRVEFFQAPLFCAGGSLAVAGASFAEIPLHDLRYSKSGPDLHLSALVRKS